MKIKQSWGGAVNTSIGGSESQSSPLDLAVGRQVLVKTGMLWSSGYGACLNLKCSGWRAGVGPGVGLGPPPSSSGSVSTAAAPAAVLLAARTSSALGARSPVGGDGAWLPG